ncbi:MSMEG_0570 family nitrogen starvation response protein [Oculatella sp. LEGE 06141]|uniref:MSMEG_0570 family nitrogen starvation response protein n=1 Tax=Oculatella sp. LEGE 06141 TaxID=1828648 RepID=UPI001880EED2|nr:MSMEG_0570 family nitrogen starvation response protein [Oculatella sp. LEGE 06141]MBE9181267.1 MSMEG_0570 family nitrogen starvation response protein [Oculatella sp. LEGE 06141]
MPEIRFQIELPDGSQETCYSPSLVVKDYFVPNQEYAVDDFVARSQTALQIASDRVQAKYGMPCSLALGQIARIETLMAPYRQVPGSKIRLVQFIE